MNDIPQDEESLPWLWLEEDEKEVRLPCGCVLERSHDGRDPSFDLCRAHLAGPALAEALGRIDGVLEVYKKEHVSSVDAVDQIEAVMVQHGREALRGLKRGDSEDSQ